MEETQTVEAHFDALRKLSSTDKLELIERLTAAVKNELSQKRVRFKTAFGAFESHESAEELADFIRNSRNDNRETEAL